MASDTSLVFNLVAEDHASETMGKMKEKFSTAATAISAGVAGAFAVGVNASMDLSSASSKLQAQLGIGPAKAAELSKMSAKIYAQNWGESVGEVDEAIRGVYQQIGDVSKVRGGLQGVTTDVMALAQTFDQDLGGTTAAVGQMIKTGLAKDAKDALDILTRGFQMGDDKAGDLLDTMNEYGTQFRSLGISGQMATGLISQGLKGGARDADLVADSLKEFNLRARDITSTAPAGFKALGLNAKQMAADIAAGGPRATAALQLTLDKLREYPNTSNKASVAANLFGTQSEDMQKALASLDPSTAVKALGDVGGAADKMAQVVGNNPASALESFKRQAQMKLADVSGHFIQFAMANTNVMKPVAIGLGTIAAVILAIRAGQIAWTAATTAWSAVTTVATGVQWLYNAALDANPITLIIIAVIALVAATVILWKKNDAFRAFMTAAWGLIWGAIKTGWNWLKKNWPLILGILTGPVGIAVVMVIKNFDRIKSAGSTVIGWFKKLPGQVGRALGGIGRIIAAPFRSGFNAVSGYWNRSVGAVSFSVPGWVPGVGGKGFSFPNMPYLAKGGHILGGGWAMVGERGPEAVHLGAGATVAPLTRGGMGGHLVVEVRLPGESDLLRANRKLVRVYGRGDVQVAFS